jgi:uncharacterized damage-inducible protein DinB
MAERLEDTYLGEATQQFRHLKEMADGAIAQVPAEDFFRTSDAESNSVALIVKHIAGNLRSRWTDFLTSDGEKPNRHRDQEFEATGHDSHAALLEQWEAGWSLVFETMGSLVPADLKKTVLIREGPHSVLKAIQRQLTHNAYHVGQIVFLAKQLRSADWKTLSIPRGKTEQFNAKMRERFRPSAREPRP